MEFAWFTEDEVLAFHQRLLAMDVGSDGVRDEGLLRSALSRPRNHVDFDGETDVVRLAAIYTAGIVKNHPFVDGNKRVGFVIGILFLELHGYRFIAPQELATIAVRDLAAGLISEEGYEAFLRDYVDNVE